jgi:Ca-activated chloride channel family protein
MLQFEHPYYLLSLLAVPLGIVLYLAYRRWQVKRIRALGDSRLIARQFNAAPGAGAGLRRAILLLLSAALLGAGWAALRGPGNAVSVKSRGVEVILALDVSKSMLAGDVAPSRIDRARQCLLLLLNKLQGHRVGLILFAGRAYLQSPVTTDYAMLRTVLATVGPGDVPAGGTAIGEALRLAGAGFTTKERLQKVLLILSDGETHDEMTLDAVTALRSAGVTVSTVGIGSPEGTTITDPVTQQPVTDEEGKTVISKLDEAGLRAMAKAGGGTYTLLRGATSTAATLAGNLNSIQGNALVKGSEFEDYAHYYPYFLGAAGFLLLLESFLSAFARRKKPVTVPVS